MENYRRAVNTVGIVKCGPRMKTETDERISEILFTTHQEMASVSFWSHFSRQTMNVLGRTLPHQHRIVNSFRPDRLQTVHRQNVLTQVEWIALISPRCCDKPQQLRQAMTNCTSTSLQEIKSVLAHVTCFLLAIGITQYWQLMVRLTTAKY